MAFVLPSSKLGHRQPHHHGCPATTRTVASLPAQAGPHHLIRSARLDLPGHAVKPATAASCRSHRRPSIGLCARPLNQLVQSSIAGSLPVFAAMRLILDDVICGSRFFFFGFLGFLVSFSAYSVPTSQACASFLRVLLPPRSGFAVRLVSGNDDAQRSM